MEGIEKVLLGCCLLSSCAAPSAEPRAVVVVLVDSLRPDHVNAYGYRERTTTPEIDRLVRDGAAFSNAYSNAPWTVPSVMSMMTSLYPSAIGFDLEAHLLPVRISRFGPPVKTLAQHFQGAGYATAAFTADRAVSAGYGFNRGFEAFEEKAPVDGSDLEDALDRVLTWLDANWRRRFFLFLHTYEVHLPNTHHGDAAERGSEISAKRRASADYDADLRYTDRSLARLWDFLRDRGLYDKSVIVLASDHGEGLGERTVLGRSDDHGYHLHDELLRVPLVLVAPELNQARGVHLNAPVQLVDVLPTLLDLAGIEPAGAPIQGVSLAPLLRGQSLPERPLFAEAPFQGPGWIAVRLGDFKYIAGPVRHRHEGEEMWWDRGGRDAVEELYDLASDPGETVNVLSRRPEVAAKLLELAKAMRQAGADIRRLPNPAPNSPPSDPELLERLKSLGYIQ